MGVAMVFRGVAP